jgi:hypothetical protein
MVGAVKGRGAAGSRSPGLIDSGSVRASGFHFGNKKSLRFDSNTSESVLGPLLSDAGTFTNQLTFAIWHKWSTDFAPTQLYDCLCGAGNSWTVANQGPGMYWQDTDSVHFHINEFGSSFAQADGLTSTDWNFFVGVYDGSLGSQNVKLYANGALGATTGARTASVNTSNNIEVGKTWNAQDAGGSDDFTQGNSDEFAVWNTPLSADEVTELYLSGVAGFEYNIDSGLYVSADSLRLWWRLGDAVDADGTDGITDHSGNGNHGTLTDITSANFENDVAGGGI